MGGGEECVQWDAKVGGGEETERKSRRLEVDEQTDFARPRLLAAQRQLQATSSRSKRKAGCPRPKVLRQGVPDP